jgi:hypothetical protein
MPSGDEVLNQVNHVNHSIHRTLLTQLVPWNELTSTSRQPQHPRKIC